ncbi:mercury resistance system transport protein MerF [Bosea beijingensis]
MNHRVLTKTGLAGGIVAAVCCTTPVLAIALGALGLSAWAAKADYVLIPLFLASLGLVGIGLYRRKRSSSPTARCCEPDGTT